MRDGIAAERLHSNFETTMVETTAVLIVSQNTNSLDHLHRHCLAYWNPGYQNCLVRLFGWYCGIDLLLPQTSQRKNKLVLSLEKVWNNSQLTHQFRFVLPQANTSLCFEGQGRCVTGACVAWEFWENTAITKTELRTRRIRKANSLIACAVCRAQCLAAQGRGICQRKQPTHNRGANRGLFSPPSRI